MNILELLQTALYDAFWSGLAAVGFAILFKVPRRLLVGCLIGGAAGHTVRAILIALGVSLEMGTLAGACVVGFASLYLSRYFRVPVSIFTVTGAIPMVPGVFAYRTMIGLLNAVSVTNDQTTAILTTAAINGIRTTVILGAIALGIAIPTLIFRRYIPME